MSRELLKITIGESDRRRQGLRLPQAAATRTGEPSRAWGGLDQSTPAAACVSSTAMHPAMERSAGPARWYSAMADQARREPGEAAGVRRAERAPDLSQQDLCLLADRVAELERELANAHRYLEACRAVIGARDGELLLDAIRRRSQELAQRSSR
jgi:hypothetical protein